MNAIHTARLVCSTAENAGERGTHRSPPARRPAGSLETLEVHAFELSERFAQEMILVVEIVLEDPSRPTRLVGHGAGRRRFEPGSTDDAQRRLRELTPSQLVIDDLGHLALPPVSGRWFLARMGYIVPA